jgi:Zn finger protein HypA/HybF involved in hydrogenase expression
MSRFKDALTSAVNTGRVMAKCGSCGCTLTPSDHRARWCPKCQVVRLTDWDPVYIVPENVVLS